MFHLAQVNIGMAKSAMGSDLMKVFSYNPNQLVNISVMKSVEVLKQFMFKSLYIDSLKRKEEWFEATTK